MIDHAIEQASRRWRGGYDSAKKRFGRPGSAVAWRPKCVDTLARRTRVYNFPFTGLMLLDSNSSDRHLSLCTKIGFRFVLRLHNRPRNAGSERNVFTGAERASGEEQRFDERRKTA